MSLCCVDLSPPASNSRSRDPRCVVHAVSRPKVDFQFRYAACQGTMLAWVSVDQTVHTNLDSGSARAILERIDPFSVSFCLVDAHAASVARKPRLSSGVITPASRRCKPGELVARWVDPAPVKPRSTTGSAERVRPYLGGNGSTRRRVRLGSTVSNAPCSSSDVICRRAMTTCAPITPGLTSSARICTTLGLSP